jgi:hypothetical protein
MCLISDTLLVSSGKIARSNMLPPNLAQRSSYLALAKQPPKFNDTLRSATFVQAEH